MANVHSYKAHASVLLAAGNTVVITATDQYDVDIVTLNVKNGHATTAFDAAVLAFQSHPDAGWVSVEATGWTTADNIVLTVFNLATLAGATEAVIRFRIDGIYAWRLSLSSSATDGGPVDIWGVGKGESAGPLAV